MDREDGPPSAATRREIPDPREVVPRAPTAASAFDPPGERFELGDQLGAGGMGRVVAATDRALDRDVAIKQILEDDDLLFARFEREVRITARLEHPSIVPIHDAGRDRHGRPYYVMRRLDGEPLANRIEATAAAARLALVPNVLAAVDAAAFAHARNIIHRDIKPWNILVGAYGETLLIDWGLAREVGEVDEAPGGSAPRGSTPLTQLGHVVGTPGYMSPEQARGEPADARTDVYALGATLLHVLTGVPCKPGERAAMPDEVPDELIAIVDKAMAPDAAARYRDAGELATDLRAFLAGKLVAAHRYTRRERLARFVRQHRVAIAIAAIAIAALGVIGGLSIANVIHERDRADAARIEAESERALATERAETNLLDRASSLVRTDPTRAVALLRDIPRTSRHLRRARDIASAAVANGIEHAAATDVGLVLAVWFESDDRSLLVVGRAGKVAQVDLATAAVTPIAQLSGANEAFMHGSELIVVGYPKGLFVIDPRSRRLRDLAPDAEIETAWLVGDRVRYHDRNARKVFERSLAAAGPAVVIASDAVSAQGVRGMLLVYDGVHRKLVDGNRTMVLDIDDVAVSSKAVAVSETVSRFAIIGTSGVFEYDFAGNRLRHMPGILGGHIFYDRSTLHGVQSNGSVVVVVDVPRDIYRFANALTWSTKIPGGSAVLSADGTIVMFDRLGTHPLVRDVPGNRVITNSHAGRYLAMGSDSGLVRWIDLATVRPREYPTSAQETPCWVDEHRIFTSTMESISIYDRATGAKRDVAAPLPMLDCNGVVGNYLFGTSAGIAIVLDLASGELVYRAENSALDLTGLRVVRGHERQLFDYDIATRRETPVFTAPGEIEWFTSTGRWLLVHLAAGVALRYDRETKNVVGLLADHASDHIDDAGTITLINHGNLVQFDGRYVATIARLPRTDRADVYPFDGGVGVRYPDRALWVVADGKVINRVPPTSMLFAPSGPDDTMTRYVMDQKITRLHLLTGEQDTRELDVISAKVAKTGELEVFSHNLIAIIQDPVPRDPTWLHAWIDTATNARIEPSGALAWGTR